jgi:Tfp pilus assembly protein PilN
MRWAEINLVDWRYRDYRRGVTRWLVMLLFSSLVVFGGYGLQYTRLNNDIEQAQIEVRTLEAKLASLQVEMSLMDDLEASQSALVLKLQHVDQLLIATRQWWQFVEELPNWIGDGLYLQSLHYKDKQVKGTGVAKTTESLTHMLSRLESSSLQVSGQLHDLTPNYLWLDQPYFHFQFSMLWNASNALREVWGATQ